MSDADLSPPPEPEHPITNEAGPTEDPSASGEAPADDNGTPAPDPEVSPAGEPEAADPPDPRRLARMLLIDVVYGDLERVEEAIIATCPKMETQSAGRMGYGTTEVGDLVCKAL